jgi:cysteine desulfurase
MAYTYLDHAASSPVKPAVAEVMQRYLTEPELMGNPSSNHVLGRKAKAELERLRGEAAEHFACEPKEVIFNSGGSEGDNHALLGTVRSLLASGNKKPRIAVSAIEHEAVVQAAVFCRELGAQVQAIRCDSHGVVTAEAVRATLKEFSPQILSVMAVNNETGVVQPVEQIAELAYEFGALYHCDAVRSVGHGLPTIQRKQAVRILTATAHKFGGPRGSGVMILRQPAPLAPVICGGGQEGGMRAGTQNLAGIAGFVEALKLATDEEAARTEALREKLETRLLERCPGCVINGHGASRATHITSVSFPGKSGEILQLDLNLAGIAVGIGSACQSAKGSAGSSTLAAMGVTTEAAAGTLRISLGWSTTEEHVDAFLGQLEVSLARA